MGGGFPTVHNILHRDEFISTPVGVVGYGIQCLVSPLPEDHRSWVPVSQDLREMGGGDYYVE